MAYDLCSAIAALIMTIVRLYPITCRQYWFGVPFSLFSYINPDYNTRKRQSHQAISQSRLYAHFKLKRPRARLKVRSTASTMTKRAHGQCRCTYWWRASKRLLYREMDAASRFRSEPPKLFPLSLIDQYNSIVPGDLLASSLMALVMQSTSFTFLVLTLLRNDLSRTKATAVMKSIAPTAFNATMKL
jgi:hypothetical protein